MATTEGTQETEAHSTNPYPTPDTQPPFSICLFGSFATRIDGQPLPPLRSVKGQHLLALLALRNGQDVSRQWLAETLWPDSMSAEGLASLRQSLADLRRALGEEAYRLQSPTKSTLRLDTVGAAIDLIAFDKCVKRRDVASLRQAVALYQGSLLEGVQEAWALGEREARQQAYLRALEMLAAFARVDGHAQGEIDYLRRIAACDPLHEMAVRALMQALARAGELQQALEIYQALRRRLHDAQNAQPTPETYAVYQELRDKACHQAQTRSVTGASAPPPTTTHNSQLTTHSQISIIRLSEQPTGNVPLPLSSLIGREEALREIEARLFTARLVTLTGTGGVGKTRLAVQIANDLITDFADGVWFIDLSACEPSSPSSSLSARLDEHVAQEILSVLGIMGQAARTPIQTLADALRTRQILLVLDNCETLVDACAQTARELLRAAPNLRLLATSRQKLGLAGECAYPVPPLALPDAEEPLPIQEIASPAIRLFLERAQAVRPDFSARPENLDAIANICRRLDGLPLALELAAALSDMLTPHDIARLLEDRFTLLGEQDRTRPLRHRTLRAVIESSVTLLSPAERVLLRYLSVFVGGWTVDAAQAVCKGSEDGRRQKEDGKEDGRWKTEENTARRVQDSGFRIQENTDEGSQSTIHNPQSSIVNPEHLNIRTPEHLNTDHPTPASIFRLPSSVFPLLHSLVGKSLVVAEERNGQMRYRLLESLREYAWEELAQANEAALLRDSHLEVYADLACLAEPQLTGPRQAVWLEKLETEGGNLRSALQWAETRLDCRVRGLQLASALGRFWQIRGHFVEGRDQILRLLDMPETENGGVIRADALNWVGLLSVFQGDFALARARCEEGYALFEQLGNEKGTAGSLGILGIVAAGQGDYASARQRYGQALERARAVEDRFGVAGTLGYLGITAANQGYYEEARACYEESLALREQLQDRWGIAASLNNLGQLARKMGDLERAHDLLTQTLAIRREMRDRRNVGITLNVLGMIAWQQGNLEVASACCAESLALFIRLGDRRSVAYGLEMAARLAVSLQEAPCAARLHGAAQQVRVGIGSPLPTGEQQEIDRDVQPALLQLGERDYRSAREQGTRLSVEEAVHEALHVTNLSSKLSEPCGEQEPICP